MDIKQRALEYFQQLGFEPKQTISLGYYYEVVTDGTNSLQLSQNGSILFANFDFTIIATTGKDEMASFKQLKSMIDERREQKSGAW